MQDNYIKKNEGVRAKGGKKVKKKIKEVCILHAPCRNAHHHFGTILNL
jgi:hypothetical protein